VKDDRLYLVHILECIERIERYAEGGEDSFFADTKTQDAVVRNLQVMAESTQRISSALKSRHQEIDWRSIAAFRNVLVHDYLGTDLRRVWDVVERDLSILKRRIQTILNELGGAA